MSSLAGASAATDRYFADHVNPDSVFGALVYLALFALLARVAALALRRAIQARVARDEAEHLDTTALKFTRGLGSAGIWIFAFVLYAHLIPPLRALGTALLAGVSVVSIVVGMAAQNTLGNLVAGFALLAYRPFRVGDRIEVAGPAGIETGAVELISLGYTALKTADNRRVLLPNSVIAGQVIVNLSAVESRLIATVPVSIGYGADVARARALLLELAGAQGEAKPPFACPVVALGASSVDLALQVWCADVDAAGRIKADLLERIKQRFGEEGIEIPFPTSNVIVIRPAEPAR
ncbi:MAG: mechanosensitive ion channel family protein [Burkholderiales bacterium]|nr:mechanosensitive ion channel family protein [Burkholderiales bacterium]MDE1925738.1 mechanosensitive ion channel family protein [Burkholderiales bacterium]MDE2157986.1 mechanosensitive ion channel family protein [Burkholderiales bacterium]MDE2502574.1 mechanosensitive ion channel family protein [Burkholderiales bacterium]